MRLKNMTYAINSDESTTTCAALMHNAYQSHISCYLDDGFCELGVHNWEAIIEVVELKSLFENWDAFTSSVKTLAGCGKLWAFLVAKGFM